MDMDNDFDQLDDTDQLDQQPDDDLARAELTALVAAADDVDTRARAGMIFGPEAAGMYDEEG